MKDFLHKLIRSLIIVILMAIFQYVFPRPQLYHYAYLLLGVMFFCFLVIPSAKSAGETLSRELKKRCPKIGILNGSIVSPVREFKCERSWTNVTTSIWLSELRKALRTNRLKRLRLIPVSGIDSSYSMIINPFGDNFPEEDVKLHKTFYRICDYVKNGGLYICTGGAFWTHQNCVANHTCEWVLLKNPRRHSVNERLLII